MKTTLLPLLIALALVSPATAAADSFEPNDSIPEAYGPLLTGTPIQSYINDGTDEDWYYFDAEVGDLTIALTTIPAGADFDLYLTDEAGNVFTESDNPDNEDEVIVGTVTGSGRFWILILGYEGSFDPSHAYTLTVTFTPINTDPVVAVIYPNGGETLTGNSSVNLQWSANDVEDGTNLTVDLAYSADDGATWTPIATGLTNDGSAIWTVPAQATTQGRVRVTAQDPDGASASDASDAAFTIVPGVTPVLTLSVPQGLVTTAGAALAVPVSFDANVSVAALQFALTYPPDVLTPVSVTGGPRGTALTLESHTGVAGEVRVVFYSTAGAALPPGTGVACTVNFQVAASPAGNAALGFSDVVAGDGEGASLPVTAVGAGVTPVRGVTLTAEAAADGVRLRWTAEADDAHAGFRVLREERGDPLPLHDGLLAADARSYPDRTAAPERTHRYWLEAVARDGSVQRFGPVEAFVAAGPLWAGLPYPNPSRETVTLEVRSAPGAPARAVVVDLTGRVVRELTVPAAGTISWDGRLSNGATAPAGIYFLHVRQGADAITRRVVRLAGR